MQEYPRWPGRHLELRTGGTEVGPDVGTAALHVRETPGPDGADELAVFVHGLSGSAVNWTDLAGLLGDRMPGVAVDLPGFGRSEPPHSYDYRMASTARLLICLLTQLDRGPVHLFGNSMGGLAALLVAARAPELVRTLTLISPAMPDLRPDPRRASDPRLLLAMLPVLGRRMRRRLALVSPRERAEQIVRLCFAHPEQVSEPRMQEATEDLAERATQPWATHALRMSSAGLLHSWLRTGSRSTWALARTVRTPTLVIWGAQDRLVSVRKARWLAATLPDSRLVVLPETGHVAQLEQPELVARAMLGMRDALAEGRW